MQNTIRHLRESVCCRPDSHDILDIKNILDVETDITFSQIVERFVTFYGCSDVPD